MNPSNCHFSYSCGYKKAYDEYENIILDKYPDIVVRGGNYDAPGFNMYFSKIILIAKFLLIFLVMSSFDIFGFFGMEPPSYYRWCLENKLFACMMAFFFGNMLEAQVSYPNLLKYINIFEVFLIFDFCNS